MAFDRSKYREQIIKRTQESLEQGDYGQNLKYFRADIDFSLWSAGPTKKGEKPHLIDIIPSCAGPNFPLPLDRRGRIKEGDLVYVMRVWVHLNIGPNKIMIVCPAKNYDNPCPICEDYDERNSRGEDYKSLLSITAKQRCVYNVYVWDNKEEQDKGVQVFEGSYKYTEKQFKALGISARTNEVIPFADPDIGQSISFNVGIDEFKTPDGFKLEPRSGYTITDDILEAAYQLDQLLLIKHYDDIAELYHKGGVVDDSPDNPKNYEQEEPKNTRLRNSAPPVREEVKEEVKENSGLVCPSPVGNFGKDCNTIDPCSDCEIFDACEKEYNIIEEKRKAAVAARGNRRQRV